MIKSIKLVNKNYPYLINPAYDKEGGIEQVISIFVLSEINSIGIELNKLHINHPSS
jgi:hypothetical protein